LVETTALGAAFLAGLGTGVWSSTDELRETWQLDRAFTPRQDRTSDQHQHQDQHRDLHWRGDQQQPGSSSFSGLWFFT
ncbi:MAG: hypothetical protein MUO50_11120, partial [Longimicrobiales bacterium]|nr:hypothetical protein [Longimicrobiales bacterium]